MEDSIWLLWVVMDSRGRRSQPQISYVKENAPYVKTFTVYHHESFDPNMDLTVLPLWVQSALPWINEPFLMAKKKKTWRSRSCPNTPGKKCASTGK